MTHPTTKYEKEANRLVEIYNSLRESDGRRIDIYKRYEENLKKAGWD